VSAVNREGEEKESEMRKIVAGLQVTLDGVIETPERWNGPYFSPELGQIVGSLIGAGDTLLLGRVTYQTFAAAFGGQSGGMADQMNDVRKVVVSTTLDRADWQNSTLIKSNVADQIIKLKQQPGKDVNVSGSATLLSWLLRQGLVDELHLLVMPVVVSQGKRLFAGDGNPVPLTLTRSDALSNGVLYLVYKPADS
jgi:dihydrofolate reductase